MKTILSQLPLGSSGPGHLGFILNATYVIAEDGDRAVVQLYGKLQDGRPFLIRDRRPEPYFYIESSARERARAAGVTRLTPTDRVTLTGERVDRVGLTLPQDAPPLRSRLHRAGVPTYEADVRFAYRYLIDRGIQSGVAIHGTPQPLVGNTVVFDDPELEPAAWTPELTILSFDIETDPDPERLLSIALWGCGAREVLLWCPDAAARASCPAGAVPCASEQELLATFAERVRALDPDVLTGWSIIDYDVPVLLRRAAATGVSLELGRAPGAMRQRGSSGGGRVAGASSTVGNGGASSDGGGATGSAGTGGAGTSSAGLGRAVTGNAGSAGTPATGYLLGRPSESWISSAGSASGGGASSGGGGGTGGAGTDDAGTSSAGPGGAGLGRAVTGNAGSAGTPATGYLLGRPSESWISSAGSAGSGGTSRGGGGGTGGAGTGAAGTSSAGPGGAGSYGGRRFSDSVFIPGRVVLDGIRLLRAVAYRLPSYSLDNAAREILGEGKRSLRDAHAREHSRRSVGEQPGDNEGDREDNHDGGPGGEHVGDSGSSAVDRIRHAFAHQRERFVDYNLTDARLVYDILEKLQLVPFTVERSKLTGMPPDRVGASIAAFDFLYLSQLHARGVVAPTVGAPPDPAVGSHNQGGHVLESRPGLHDNVLVFDFKSLYPSIIRTFQIDPLGLIRTPAAAGPAAATAATGAPAVAAPGPGAVPTAPASDPAAATAPAPAAAAGFAYPSGVPDGGLIEAPNGARFRRERAILSGLLDDLFASREHAKRTGNRVASNAIKILMNSFYGVLGTPSCRFSDPRLANAITGFGKHFLLWAKAWMERRGLQVLYGDTDSLFVATARAGADQPLTTTADRLLPERDHLLPERDRQHTEPGRLLTAPGRALTEPAERLAGELNRDLAAYIQATWHVPSHLEMEFERRYERLFLPPVRGGGRGATKRYVGMAQGKLHFTGMEVVRRDWTALAHEVQRELYRRLFADEPLEEYLRQVIGEVAAGRRDAQLVYHKALRKEADAYQAVPPHVAAARKRTGPPSPDSRREVIDYVITVAGPEPVEGRADPLDYEHYIDRQIRPVAEPVLAIWRRDFGEVRRNERQLELF